MSHTVPDDVIRSLELGEVELGVYRDGIVNVTVRFVDGTLPLKLGERVEVEVVAIERRVVER